MTSSSFKGERLKNARLYRGLTLAELATKTDVTKQALSQYENGTINPEMPKVLALSEALGFPLDYFFAASQYSVKTEATYFRSLMSTNKKDRVAQSVRIEFIAQIYETLFEYINFPPLHLPEVSITDSSEAYEYEAANEVDELEAVAQKVREYWHLGDGPIKDLRYTLEANGIVVTCYDPNSEKIDAFSQRTLIDEGGTFFIVISKKNQSLARARFDMAHELAHILIHPWSEDLESITKEEFKARERQANILASAFLLPRQTFGADVAHYPTNLDYYEHLKKKWNVSIQAMIYRTQQLGLITTTQYQYLMRQISKKQWRNNEPGDIPYEMTSNLLQGAVDALLREKVFTADSFMLALKNKGIVLQREEVEALLCLKSGTLKRPDSDKPVLIQLKPR